MNDFPEQMDPLLLAITGREWTMTVATAVLDERQPAVLVPVTE